MEYPDEVRTDYSNLPNTRRSQLCLLSYFLKPRSLFSILSEGWDIEWEEKLGEYPKITIDRFISLKLIREASTKEKTEFNLTVDQLQSILYKHGIQPKPLKEDLIEQLLKQIKIEEISPYWVYKDVYVCTKIGTKIGREFQDFENERKIKAFTTSVNNLSKGNLLEAVKIFQDYERLYCWPDPFRIHKGNNDPNIIVSKLQEIASRFYNGSYKNIYNDQDILLALIRFLWKCYENELPKLYGSNEILTRIPEYSDDKAESKIGFYNGRHFVDYVEIINQLKREKRYNEALIIILGCIDTFERDHIERPPWFFSQAAIVYRKLKIPEKAKEYDILYQEILEEQKGKRLDTVDDIIV